MDPKNPTIDHPYLRLCRSDSVTTNISPVLVVDPRRYEAFLPGDHPPRLRIQCHPAPAHSLSYAALLDIVFGEEGTEFLLVFPHVVVHVTGRNLGAVVDAINDHQAASIFAYSPTAFDRPAGHVAVIEEVEFEIAGTAWRGSVESEPAVQETL